MIFVAENGRGGREAEEEAKIGAIMARRDEAAGFELRNARRWARKWTCVPTALSAVSGFSCKAVWEILEEIIDPAARPNPRRPREDYGPCHWRAAIPRLKAKVQRVYAFDPHGALPPLTIAQFMAIEAHRHGLLLVHCRDFNANIGHVFATQRGNIVDSETRGEMVEFRELASLTNCRVIEAFEVSPD